MIIIFVRFRNEFQGPAVFFTSLQVPLRVYLLPLSNTHGIPLSCVGGNRIVSLNEVRLLRHI